MQRGSLKGQNHRLSSCGCLEVKQVSMLVKVFGFAVFILLMFSIVPICQSQSIYYVRAGAAGSHDGSDWFNAFNKLPHTLERGATYYIADGKYGSYTFDDPNWGSLFITLKKATLRDHGTNSGWDQSYGDGVAEFGNLIFSSDYYIIDGQRGGGPGQWETNFGFKVSGSGRLIDISGRHDIQFFHVDMAGPGREVGDNNYDIIYGTNAPYNITISYCYLHDIRRCQIITRSSRNILVEYSKIARNGPSNDGIHKEAWSATDDDNVVIRYCIFEDISNTGIIALVNGSGVAENWEIYGNVFLQTGNVDNVSTNGEFYLNHEGLTGSSIRFYNNTIINITGLAAGVRLRSGGSAEAYNNIWYGCAVNTIAFDRTTHDYNYYSKNFRYEGCDPPCSLKPIESHGQYASISPFVDVQGKDFHLRYATSSGINLPFMNQMDAEGKIRGGDGNWDRGAYEFIVQDIQAPGNLRIISE